MRALIIASCLALASGFVVPRPVLLAAPRASACTFGAPPLPAATAAVAAAAVTRAPAPSMGLFGLGTPEIAIIAGVALLVLGPDQVKKLAKDVGKISAELKQVPEEFNKGVEVGTQELAEKKAATLEGGEAPPAAAPPTPPPAA